MSEIDLEKIQQTVETAAEGLNTVVQAFSNAVTNAKIMPPQLYKNVKGDRSAGILKGALGIGLTAAGAIILLPAAGVVLAGGSILGAVTSLIGGGLLIALGVPISVNGMKAANKAERFKQYVSYLGNKTVVQLKNLAEFTGKSVDYVRKDVQDMMQSRYFMQGHLDEQKETLMVSDKAYSQYKRYLEDKARLDEELKQEDQALTNAGLSTAGLAIVKQGQNYLQYIREANAALPGEEITRKLSALENTVRNILSEVKRRPDKATDLRKLVNYYLPTTRKLLDAYREIEAEPVKTASMQKTEADIEKTLDTINQAFERLLDQIFNEKAVDLSADIQVLNTMFRQEGLLGNDFKKTEDGNNE